MRLTWTKENPLVSRTENEKLSACLISPHKKFWIARRMQFIKNNGESKRYNSDFPFTKCLGPTVAASGRLCAFLEDLEHYNKKKSFLFQLGLIENLELCLGCVRLFWSIAAWSIISSSVLCQLCKVLQNRKWTKI